MWPIGKIGAPWSIGGRSRVHERDITDEALAVFAAAYPGEAIGKDDVFDYVYGLLHSPEYRETYASDLKKMLPRIPFAGNFRAFADAGEQLAELHLGYETVEPYPLEGLDVDGPGGDADYGFFAVGSKKMSFGKPTAEQKAEGLRHDRSVIHYNERITLRGVPAEAYRYTLGSRSAIEWIIDRYWGEDRQGLGHRQRPQRLVPRGRRPSVHPRPARPHRQKPAPSRRTPSTSPRSEPSRRTWPCSVRGEVYRLPARGRGREQRGRRYAVVLQPDWLTLSTWVVAFTSATARRTSFRPVVEIADQPTLVMCDQLATVELDRLTEPVGCLTLDEMQRVGEALSLILDL